MKKDTAKLKSLRNSIAFDSAGERAMSWIDCSYNFECDYMRAVFRADRDLPYNSGRAFAINRLNNEVLRSSVNHLSDRELAASNRGFNETVSGILKCIQIKKSESDDFFSFGLKIDCYTREIVRHMLRLGFIMVPVGFFDSRFVHYYITWNS